MSTIFNIYGFTGSIWDTPDIDSLSTEKLLSNYRDIFFTQIKDDKYYLGTRDNINAGLGTMLARAVLEGTVLTTELTGPVELIESEWRLVMDGIEHNATVTFPSNEKIVINGGRYIATHNDGSSRYVPALGDNMSRNLDPIIGTSQVFYDCELFDISLETLTTNYENSLLLIGGILIETRKLYDSLSTSVNLKGKLSGWLPTLYKKVAEFIGPHECGLNWPILIEDLQNPELYNKLIEHKDSRLIVFKSRGPVTYQERPISNLFPSPIKGILCYDGRPSPNRVTDLHHGSRSPTKNDLYPIYLDIEGSGKDAVTIDYVVKNIPPKEHIITFIDYEVKS